MFPRDAVVSLMVMLGVLVVLPAWAETNRINAKDKAREENGQIIRPRETRSAMVYWDV